MGDAEKTRTYLLGVIAIVLVFTVFYFMQPFAIPVVLAVFFAVLARPLHKLLRRYLWGWLAILLVVVVIGLLLVSVPFIFATNVEAIAEKLPEYKPRIEEIVAWLRQAAANVGIDPKDIQLGPGTVESLLGLVTNSARDVASVLGTMVLTIFTMIFVLTEANVLRDKLAVAMNPENEAIVLESVQSMSFKVQRYVSTKTLISFMNGGATGLFTWALGIDFPFVWAVLTFVLNFIPNFGTLISMVPPVLLALIQFDSPTTAIIAMVGLLVVYNVIGNVLEPRLLGRALSLSPLVVFISLLFWGWYWGFVGVVLSIPLTVAMRIVCEHIDALRPIAILMGEDPRRGVFGDSVSATPEKH